MAPPLVYYIPNGNSTSPTVIHEVVNDLGGEDDSSTSNAAESNKHVLKSATDKEEMSIMEFISLAKSFELHEH